MVQYRALAGDELCRELFRDFIRRQAVTKCWRRERGCSAGWTLPGRSSGRSC